jgi:hypothetical protein
MDSYSLCNGENNDIGARKKYMNCHLSFLLLDAMIYFGEPAEIPQRLSYLCGTVMEFPHLAIDQNSPSIREPSAVSLQSRAK